MAKERIEQTTADKLVETLECLRIAENHLWRLRIDAAQQGDDGRAAGFDRAHHAVSTAMRKSGAFLSAILTDEIKANQ